MTTLMAARPHPATHRLVAGTTPTTTLADAHDLIRIDDKGKWDTIVPRTDLEMRDGQLLLRGPAGYETLLRLSPWATGQLCTRLGIPAGYFRRCPAELQDSQANHWLKRPFKLRSRETGPDSFDCDELRFLGDDTDASQLVACDDEAPTKSWRLRAQDNRLRAVLSDKFSPMDNATLMESLGQFFQSHHRIDWIGLSPESLHLRIVDPLSTKDVLPGDGLMVGIHVANSEVGFRAITVDALVYRLVCSNGLIRLVKGKSLLRQRHVHLQQPRFVAALETAVADAFVTADEFVEQLRRATTVPVANVEETIEAIGRRWELPDSTVDIVKVQALNEPPRLQETLYGLVNAFTATAQQLPHESRYDLEVLAGRLAEHGVDAYAPKKGDRAGELSDPHGALSRARELFGAEVMAVSSR